nr:polysaccharide deacetylase [Pseudoroseomonas ludipueritiae]
MISPGFSNPYVPLALEEDDIATFSAIAEALGCTPEECGEGFMMATPLARDAAVMLWRGAVAAMPQPEVPQTAARIQRLRDTLGTLRALLGLDPLLMPIDALAEAGLRYRI